MSESRQDGNPSEPIEDLLEGSSGEERELLAAIARRLEARPVPRPSLRSAIRADIAASDVRRRPANLRRMAAAYLCSGALLLALAGAGLAGIGPLGG